MDSRIKLHKSLPQPLAVTSVFCLYVRLANCALIPTAWNSETIQDEFKIWKCEHRLLILVLEFYWLINGWRRAVQWDGAIRLVERQKGVVAGLAAIAIEENERTLGYRKSYPCVSAVVPARRGKHSVMHSLWKVLKRMMRLKRFRRRGVFNHKLGIGLIIIDN